MGSTHEVIPQDLSPIFPIGLGDLGVSQIKASGLVDLYRPAGANGRVVIVEDRDRVAKVARDRRFPWYVLKSILELAQSVTIVICFGKCRPSNARHGAGAQDEAHGAALAAALAMGGTAVVVLTGSDRLRHWLTQVRMVAAPDCRLQVLDSQGAYEVFNEFLHGRAAA